MHRTTVMLPRELKRRAARTARRRGISLGELVREALEERLAALSDDEPTQDPFIADAEVFSGPVPGDLSTRHDAYLYDE